MSNKRPTSGGFKPRISESLQRSIRNGLKGCEKEGLRLTPEGSISRSPHPVQLGAALTHPNITTDYSEALLELITPALSDGSEMLGFLTNLHRQAGKLSSRNCKMQVLANLPLRFCVRLVVFVPDGSSRKGSACG